MKVEHRQIVERVRPARRLLVDDHAIVHGCARAPLASIELVGEVVEPLARVVE